MSYHYGVTSVDIKTPCERLPIRRSFWCARHGQQLSGERPERARQQEALAEGKGVHREVESEGSRMSRRGTLAGKLPNRRTEIT